MEPARSGRKATSSAGSLSAARKAAGHTQESLAELLDVDRTTVARWEAGLTAPRPSSRPRLAAALRLPPERLAAVLVTDDASAGDRPPDLDDLRYGVVAAVSGDRRGRAVLRYWEHAVDDHGRASRYRAPAAVLDEVASDLAHLRHQLAECRSPTVRRELVRVVALLSGLVCLTLVTLDRTAAARRWARAARVAAGEVDDPATCSWIRAQEAYGQFYGGDPRNAISLALDAQRLAGRRPAVGAVLAAALRARAHAVVGDRRNAHDALDTAQRLSSSLGPSCPTDSALGYSEAQLRFHQGNALMHLRDTTPARRAQQRALELYPVGDHLDRALVQLDSAQCAVHDGEVDTAVSAMAALLDGLPDARRGGLIDARVRTIVALLPPDQRARPVVRELVDPVATTRGGTG